ncbi:MAG TPA: glutamine amidotransferase family protein [Syntrophomonadaceae bacterium]|nr:glutamine amidotransferase family protein [Syntrophomonadaceae bacterium]
MMREGQIRIPSGCAVSGIINRCGNCFSGTDIINSIALMHERSNGLGGGFAAYGIYPGYSECYALHIFYDNLTAKEEIEKSLYNYFKIHLAEEIPTRKNSKFKDAPIIWRYFATPLPVSMEMYNGDEDESTARFVLKVNSTVNGVYIFSSGKNMGAFKAVGYPEDVGDYYRLDEYKGYLWTAHGRFPTNTPGWWGGAHPFALLDWSVVHNGEISSYDANRRFLAMYDYICSLQTDTEVITYLFDLLLRKHRLSLQDAVLITAPPLWSMLEKMDQDQREHVRALRMIYGSALLNGPFSIILAANNGLIALNDRLKLRSLVAAEQDEYLYVASEEAAIRVIADPDKVWSPAGGEAVMGLLYGKDNLYDSKGVS